MTEEEKLENKRIGARDRMRKWYARNPGKAARRMRAWRAEKGAAYLEKRKAYRRGTKTRARTAELRRLRYATDVRFRLGVLLRNRMWEKIKRADGKKVGSAVKIVGCELGFLKQYLEEKFRDGMTWANHGALWEIDHIKACARFDLTDPEQQKLCFHYTNLQPLLETENGIKSDRE